MNGYIISFSSKVIKEKTYIQLFGRLENGKSFSSLSEFKPYFFIKESDLKKASPLLKEIIIEKTSLANFKGEKVTKLLSEKSADRQKISSALRRKGIETYESDLNPTMQFIIDMDLYNSIDIKGDSEANERVDLFFMNPDIKASDYKPELKIISLDIEGIKKDDRIICIGMYGRDYSKSFIISEKKIEGAISCKDERELLQKFRDEMISFDPDIITGWNVVDFDLIYMKRKFDENKMPFDIGRTSENVRFRIESNFLKQSSISIPGRQVLDGFYLLKDPFIQEAPSIKNRALNSYNLEDVSQEILGEGKTLKGKKRYDIIEDMYKNDGKKLVEYNMQDCKLAYKILEKTKVLDLAIERTSLTGLPMNRLTASVAAFDSLYIREARKKGLVSPYASYQEREQRITGGYVMESLPGIYHNVIVLDFKSLYPSIIRTFNIDPASFIEKKEPGSIESPNKAYFRNQSGILPEIIERLHHAREKAKKEKRELSSYAIKIIMNSFFGVLASPSCRYYSLKMANAITHFGQSIIKMTAREIEKKGYKVIYSDTDSVFVETDSSKEKADRIGKEIEEYINKFYKDLVKKDYNRESFLELEFEKQYISFLMPKVRGSEAGSKKRYAGLIEKNGKEIIEIVGLEAIRGDWTDAAGEFQRELLNRIFHKQEFVQFIRDYVKSLKSGKFDSKLVYKKSLRKSLEEYTKTTPPHVKAARQLDSIQSSVIEYYMTEKGPEPIQKLKNKIDYDHYINKQIKPIADTILYFFKKDFDEVMKTSKQMKLF